MKERLSKLDAHTAIILVLVLASTGHVGQLFAERESANWAALGYVMAFGIESVSVLSLYQAAMSSGRKRAISLAVFVAVCGLLASLNTQYYRQNKPGDPLWFSVILGASLPVLAALMSALRALQVGTVEETQRQERESERQQELDHALAMETVRLEAETRVQIAVKTEKEKTKQGNTAVRLARVEESKRRMREAKAQQEERLGRLVDGLGNERATYDHYLENPHASRVEVAQAVGVSVKTIGNHHKRLRSLGLIGSNGKGETT